MRNDPLSDPGGRLHITLTHADGRIARVAIRSSRPVHAVRVLIGRTPGEAVRLVPLLFSLCGGAQRIAAEMACEQARKQQATPAEQAARTFALQVELVREHALRILLDWPAVLGLEADRGAAAGLFARLHGLTEALAGTPEDARAPLRQLSDLVRGCVLGDTWTGLAEEQDAGVPTRSQALLPRLMQALQQRGWQGLGAGSAIPGLEDFGRQGWQARLANATQAYAERPEIDGQARETTPYTRQLHTQVVQAATRRWRDGLATRLLALAAELDGALEKLSQHLEQACRCGRPGSGLSDLSDQDASSGVGIGVAEAARGKLMHRIRLSRGRIQDYLIVAPTEWNFHPHGVAARLLAQLPFGSEETCRAQARALICAIDPCVAYDLEIRHHA